MTDGFFHFNTLIFVHIDSHAYFQFEFFIQANLISYEMYFQMFLYFKVFALNEKHHEITNFEDYHFLKMILKSIIFDKLLIH